MGMNVFNDSIFRAYDIRGIYPTDIDERFASLCAKGLITYLKGRRIAVSMDVRESNEELARPFIEALVESGAEVWFIGVMPTPLLYFTIAHYGLDGGAAVSASHNPAEWNGFKLCGKGARVLGWGEGMEKIKDLMEREMFTGSGQKGLVREMHDEVLKEYENFIKQNCSFTRKLKVAIDPGNGASSGFASGLMKRMPIDVTAINDIPDGKFPSRNPEPKPETITGLVEVVRSEGLDFGVAFDGDGDRAMFVDDKGTVLYGDRVLALFAENMLQPEEKVVYEVSCSNAVVDTTKKKGGVPIISKVGHSSVQSKMTEEDARMGGEISGHLYFRETYYFDDAFFAAAKMAELVSNSGRKLSELTADLPEYVRAIKEFDAPDKEKFAIVERIKKGMEGKGFEIVDIDGVKAIKDDGWFIIRASNTTPKIKMTAEATDKKRLDELVSIGENALLAAQKE